MPQEIFPGAFLFQGLRHPQALKGLFQITIFGSITKGDGFILIYCRSNFSAEGAKRGFVGCLNAQPFSKSGKQIRLRKARKNCS